MFSLSKPKADVTFGPPYAVLNVSKIGLRYFRICIHCSAKSRERLVKKFVDHPNIGWIFEAEGWFNLAVGVWGKDNAEINDIGTAIRAVLGEGDTIVYQSELTSLYSFGDRNTGAPYRPMPIIDAVYAPVELSPLELDYIKILTLDSSMPKEEMAEILGVQPSEVDALDARLTQEGVLVGKQERIQYGGYHFKVFIDTLSRKEENAAAKLYSRLWDDKQCIYLERANGKYDIEFELILPKKSLIKQYVKDFSEYQIAILTKNLYTNLYPLNKTANLKEIRGQLAGQEGLEVDFRNSKLWYLNYHAADAYLSIYDNKRYFELMEKVELDLFEEIGAYLREREPDTKVSLLDLGSGDGLKARVFIEKIGEERVKAYYPIDIQPIELATALRAHADGKYAKHPTLLDFSKLSARFPLSLPPDEKQICLFLGGTYGNFPHGEINGYIASLLGPSSMLMVAMPILSKATSDEVIKETYTNGKVEDLAFGPLLQLGFNKQDFEPNPTHPGLFVQVNIEDRRLVTSFVLAEDKQVSGYSFNKGTRFKLTTSWKPTLAEFREALERDFDIEKMFSNEGMAIALIRGKKNIAA